MTLRFKHLEGKAHGFTLVELLVVISIIGVLATLAVTSLNSVRINARDAKRLYDLRQIGLALDLYYNDHRVYPSELIPGQPIQSLFPNGPVYMGAMPRNPAPRTDGGCPDSDYFYYRITATNTYVVASCLGSPQGDFNRGPVGYHTDKGLLACGGYLADGDGHAYRTVQIGAQCWMAENLETEIRPTGTCINGGGEPPCPGGSSGSPRTCHDDPLNCETYGALYTWAAAMDGPIQVGSRGICPAGWRIPTHNDWTLLENTVCDSSTCSTDFPYDSITTDWRGTDEGEKLKTAGLSGINSYGFNAQFGGERTASDTFEALGKAGYYWSSTDFSATAWFRGFSTAESSVLRSYESKDQAYSVRCVKM